MKVQDLPKDLPEGTTFTLAGAKWTSNGRGSARNRMNMLCGIGDGAKFLYDMTVDDLRYPLPPEITVRLVPIQARAVLKLGDVYVALNPGPVMITPATDAYASPHGGNGGHYRPVFE